MNKIMILPLLILMSAAIYAQSTNAELVADRIAQKMKDSLELSNTKKQQIYSINMQLHNQKSILWQQFAGSDSLSIFIQHVENTRDSLYHNVLTEEKYMLYKQKKKNLISND